MSKNSNKEEKIIRGGIIINHGVSIGKAIVINNNQQRIPDYKLKNEKEIEEEKQRYKEAVLETQKEIKQLIDSYSSSESKLIIDILDSHLKIVEDNLIIKKVHNIIDETKKNAAYALDVFINKYIKLLDNSNNDYFKQRTHDFMEIRDRINSKLLSRENINIYDSNKSGIIVAESIPPVETAKIDKDKILGFVTEMGGATSHSSIIAKGLNIPTIIGVEDILDYIEEDDELILDAIHGEIIINPSEQNLTFYRKVRKHYEKLTKKYMQNVEFDTITSDKERIYVNSNCESVDEIDWILKSGAEGIGLYRSEFLYIHRRDLPDENEQYKAYSKVCERMFPKKVTIRTFDLGGDKFVEGITKQNYENNPYLGWRSVRIALDNKKMFMTQLRALLKASKKGNLRIMFPMISGIEELKSCLNILEEAKESLRKERYGFDENIKVGTMIEVPSAVMVADTLAKYVDFFSIGTNDLIQYTIAVDRGNKRISHLYDAYHPAILKLIKKTIETADDAGIELSVCGEVASDPFYVPIMIGMGITNISLSPSYIPEIKKMIMSIDASEWRKFWNEELKYIESKELIKEKAKEKLLDEYPDLYDWEDLRNLKS